MARPATCAIARRVQKRGTRFGLRVTYAGKRHFVPLGASWEGWDEDRVERERQLVATLLERGEWTPPQPTKKQTPRPSAPQPASVEETFAVAASRFYGARCKRMDSEKSKEALRWRLGAALAHIGDLPISSVDAAAIDDMVTALLTERDEIETADAAGKPLMQTIRIPSTGRTYQRRRKGLSNSSINKVVSAVRMVLEDSRRRQIIANQPVDRHSMVRPESPNRSFLQAQQIQAVLNTAAAVEREQRGLDWEDVLDIRTSNAPHTHLAAHYRVSDTLIRKIRRREIWVDRPQRRRNDVPRHALWAVLIGTGVRIDELCRLRADEHVDLDARRISITRHITKTNAGERVIPMLPFVHQALLAHYERHPPRPGGRLFETRNATPQTPDNVRTHVIDNIVAAANDRGAGISRCTPHSLRRTFASILAEIGIPPRRAMYLLGHTDAKFTMSVYQHVLDLGDDALSTLEEMLGCDIDEAYTVLVGRSFRRQRAAPL